jgi:hypothetical protein
LLPVLKKLFDKKLSHKDYLNKKIEK